MSSAGRNSISRCFQHGLQDGYLSLKPHVKGGLFPLRNMTFWEQDQELLPPPVPPASLFKSRSQGGFPTVPLFVPVGRLGRQLVQVQQRPSRPLGQPVPAECAGTGPGSAGRRDGGGCPRPRRPHWDNILCGAAFPLLSAGPACETLTDCTSSAPQARPTDRPTQSMLWAGHRLARPHIPELYYTSGTSIWLAL